jgi:hypothetical protein
MKLDDLIYDGIENTLDERLSQYTADLKKHHFSAAYKIRRYQTIRTSSKAQKISWKFSVRRIRYALLAVILAAFLMTGFSIWYSAGRFTFNAHSDHSVTYISKTPGDKAKIESIYGLPYETGFSMTERQSDDEDVISVYQSGDTKVTLWQSVNDDVHNFNTEYGTPEEVNINGCNGVFIPENNGECAVVWTMDGYLFTLNGNIDKMSLLNLAKATNVEK